MCWVRVDSLQLCADTFCFTCNCYQTLGNIESLLLIFIVLEQYHQHYKQVFGFANSNQNRNPYEQIAKTCNNWWYKYGRCQ